MSQEKFIKQFINEFKVIYPTVSIGYDYDEENDFYSILHNNQELQFNDKEFSTKVGNLIKEILYKNDIYNFSFCYDFDEICKKVNNA